MTEKFNKYFVRQFPSETDMVFKAALYAVWVKLYGDK
jgi:hypothetical protein